MLTIIVFIQIAAFVSQYLVTGCLWADFLLYLLCVIVYIYIMLADCADSVQAELAETMQSRYFIWKIYLRCTICSIVLPHLVKHAVNKNNMIYLKMSSFHICLHTWFIICITRHSWCTAWPFVTLVLFLLKSLL